MTEDDAKGWIETRFGGDAIAKLDRFARLVIDENSRQNLIAPSTVEVIWSRHLLDSAQIVPLARGGVWIDIGSGGGFPGMVAAILRSDRTVLVEPRRRRADFLTECVRSLSLGNVEVHCGRIENVAEPAATISARAVASIEKLLRMAAGCATSSTRWLLPRGRVDAQELAELRKGWSGMFHVEQSVTDPESTIIVLDGAGNR